MRKCQCLTRSVVNVTLCKPFLLSKICYIFKHVARTFNNNLLASHQICWQIIKFVDKSLFFWQIINLFMFNVYPQFKMSVFSQFMSYCHFHMFFCKWFRNFCKFCSWNLLIWKIAVTLMKVNKQLHAVDNT